MIISSSLFRKVFIYVQSVIVIFFVSLLVFAAPYLEKQLYKNEETVAVTFLDNVVTLIRGELTAIDSYWKSSIDERQKKHNEITELQINFILNVFNQIPGDDLESRKKILLQEFSNFQPLSSGQLLAINENGTIIFHNNAKLINKNKNQFKDAYLSPVFSSLRKDKGTFIQYWEIENGQEIEKNIYYRYVPELSMFIGMDFFSSNMLEEVQKREEQIVNSVQSLISNLSIRSGGQLLIFDNEYRIKIPPNFTEEQYGDICKSGIVSKLKSLPKHPDSTTRLQWGDSSTGIKCSATMVGWNYYFADFDWNIILVHEKEELYKASDELKSRFIIMTTLMVLAFNFLALVFIRKISVQIGSLSNVAEKVREGDLTQQAEVTSNDELGKLAVSINSMIHNIRERTEKLKSLNEDYLHAKDEAVTANKSKTRFLAAVSHDLMQPLNAAKLYLSSLSINDDLNNRIEENTATKSISALNMAEQMIKELVDISKLDAGDITPNLEEFCIQETFDLLDTNFKVLANKWGLDFKVINSSCMINSDKRFLKHILQNFISNAIRYTSEGKILLGCRRQGNYLSIQVWDTGPGIPESEQENIFQEFVKGKTVSDKGESRFGLGLAIVKKMAAILDVEITLRSWVDKGTVFSVTVPIISKDSYINSLTSSNDSNQNNNNSNRNELSVFSESNESMQTSKNSYALIEKAKSKLKDKVIICIDDDLSCLDAINTVLTKLSCQPILISSIDEIKDLEVIEITNCSLIFSDYSLQGGTTGFDAIDELCQITNRKIPAVIVSGEYSEEINGKCSISKYPLIMKPASIEKIISVINNTL
ncbi:MAG: HAMP domain-containing protein [Gammaproteobacteria bacterium]|nr:MAG: HAMP domain-containing protein [Gammaproteobacteria bacterium]